MSPAQPVMIGPAQFTLFAVVPGRTGEHRRLRAELSALQPTAIAAETDVRHVMGMRRQATGAGRIGKDDPFLPRLLRREIARRYRGEDADPVVAAYAFARERNLTFVPLIVDAPRPGLLLRWRLSRLAREIDAKDEETYARYFWRHVAQREELVIEADDAGEHLADILYRDAHPRLAVILHHAHVEPVLKEVERRAPPRPPSTEAPRELANLGEDPRTKYPAYR